MSKAFAAFLVNQQMDISPCAVPATEIGNNFRIKKFFVWEFGDDHGRVPVNIPVTVHFASTVPWPAKFIVTVFPTTVPVNLALLSKLPLGRLGTATVVNEPANAPPPGDGAENTYCDGSVCETPCAGNKRTILVINV